MEGSQPLGNQAGRQQVSDEVRIGAEKAEPQGRQSYKGLVLTCLSPSGLLEDCLFIPLILRATLIFFFFFQEYLFNQATLVSAACLLRTLNDISLSVGPVFVAGDRE